jgi:hypothetical protein
MLGDVHYLNSGDWIESLTAVVEHWDGQYELIEYSAFIKAYPMEAEETIGAPPPEAAQAAPEGGQEAREPGLVTAAAQAPAEGSTPAA